VPSAEGQRHAWRRRLAALCLAGLLGAPAVAAEAPGDKLREVEKLLEESRQSREHYAEEADALAADLAQLRADSVAAAEAAQQHERAIAQIEAQLAALAGEERTKSADLQRRAEQNQLLLMALQRLARNPPEALALTPQAPADAVRSGLLLGAAIPQLDAEARALEAELAGLAALRGEVARQRELLAAESDALDKQRVVLRNMITRKASLQEHAARGAETSGQRLAQLSAEAGDLRDLIDRLEAEQRKRAEEAQRREAQLQAKRRAQLEARAAAQLPRPVESSPEAEPPGPSIAWAIDPTRPKALRPFAAAHGALVTPVAGRLTRRYGENDEFGGASKGIVLLARPSGQVVAPFDGRIEFAGPFRGYGQILIIEHGDGYHSLLAGLEQIDGVVGQWVVAGEPVGHMPGGDHDVALYFELRRHGQPINPLPWLATRDDKVTG
jgi:septal ring factor EnvC (AmiA/AmiB activator)